MKKQLRKFLSAFLVLTMLLSALPMSAFAEETSIPVVVDVPAAETEEPIETPTTEPTEAPAAEEPEEPAAEPTEAPAAEEPEVPAAEPTEAPAAEEPEVPAAEEPEATTGEPEAMPTKEDSEPVEGDEEDPLAGLTDEQLAALSALPEGFSANVVAFAMSRSTGCAHTRLSVATPINEATESYTKLNSEKHIHTVPNRQRQLCCYDCGEVLQTIELDDSVEEEHSWYSEANGGGSVYDFYCLYCFEKTTASAPCSHDSFTLGGGRLPYCSECNAILSPGSTGTVTMKACEHAHYTVYYPDAKQTKYSKWNNDSHLKRTWYYSYDEEDGSAYLAVCNDCSCELVYSNGKIYEEEDYDSEMYGAVNVTDYVVANSDLEAHSFVNGECKYCGEKQVEEACQHTNTTRVIEAYVTIVEPFDDTQHKVAIEACYKLICEDCDACVGLDQEIESTSFEPHEFSSDDLGEGCDCGYRRETSCQHTTTKRVENTSKQTTKLELYNDTERKVVTTKYYELHCTDCDAYISDDGAEESTSKEAHDFSSGNTCACGYTKAEEACQHTTTKRVENTSKQTTKLELYNDTKHKVVTTKYYELHCTDCDAYISDDGAEESTTKEAHDFGSGNTCACGYAKAEETCQHTTTKRVENTAMRKTRLNPYDDAQHEVITSKYYDLRCADCDAYISADRPGVSTVKRSTARAFVPAAMRRWKSLRKRPMLRDSRCLRPR